MRKLLTATIIGIASLIPISAQAANSWGIAGEQEARFEATVVDIVCELSGDCPANCGGGKRQLGLLKDDGELVLPSKNMTPFSGATDDLIEFCGKRVVADGLFANNHNTKIFAIQFVKVAPDGKWRRTNKFTAKWAEANGEDAGSKKLNSWFRRDPRIKALIEKDGFLGLGEAADKKFLEEWE